MTVNKSTILNHHPHLTTQKIKPSIDESIRRRLWAFPPSAALSGVHLKRGIQTTTSRESGRSFMEPSQAISNASSCRFYFRAQERDVLYQRPFRLPLWETSSSRSSSQLSTWFMEMWVISSPAPQSSPDELLPSAHVTILCFPRRPIFIHTDKLNLPHFEEAILLRSPLFHLWPSSNYQRRGDDSAEWTAASTLGV